MTKTVGQTVNMLEMLPTQEQNLVMELVKRLVLAWDPDFTRLTPDERSFRVIFNKDGIILMIEQIDNRGQVGSLSGIGNGKLFRKKNLTRPILPCLHRSRTTVF